MLPCQYKVVPVDEPKPETKDFTFNDVIEVIEVLPTGSPCVVGTDGDINSRFRDYISMGILFTKDTSIGTPAPTNVESLLCSILLEKIDRARHQRSDPI